MDRKGKGVSRPDEEPSLTRLTAILYYRDGRCRRCHMHSDPVYFEMPARTADEPQAFGVRCSDCVNMVIGSQDHTW